MGNVVAGSGLNHGLDLNNYALLHAAVPAYSYDDTHPILEVLDLGSPDYDLDQGTAQLGYRGRLRDILGNLINFYDSADSALDGWRTNNRLYRPQPPSPYLFGSYFYHPDDSPGEKLGIIFLNAIGRFVRTPDEAMPYVDASRSLAVGAEGRTAGVISTAVNSDQRFDFGSDHGAEWNRTLQTTANFYDELMDQFNIPVNP